MSNFPQNRFSNRAVGNVRAGFWFSATTLTTAVGSGTNVDMLIRVPADAVGEFYLNVTGSGTGDGYLRLFEAPTLSADGTPIVVNNLNRRSTNLEQLLAFDAPTVTLGGKLLAAVAGPASGAAGNGPLDFLLDAGVDYLIRWRNRDAATDDVAILATWLEDKSRGT